MAITLGSTAASLGNALGTGLAEPLQQGLNLLAQHKMMQLQNNVLQQQQQQERQRYMQGLAPLLGEQTASFLSNLNPEERKAALQNIGPLMQLQGMSGQNQGGGIQALQQPMEANQQAQPEVNQKAQLVQDIFKSPQTKALEERLSLSKQKQALLEKQDLRKEKEREERLNLSKEKHAFTEQQTFKPFLRAMTVDRQQKKNAADIAQEMLQNITKNRTKWPGAIVGNLPQAAQNVLIRDPNVRKYIADANKLVAATASITKGNVTNAKLKLAELAKANLSQPIESQIDILKGVIKDYKNANHIQKFVSSLRNKEGLYPKDLEDKVAEFEMKMGEGQPEQAKKNVTNKSLNEINPAQYSGKKIKDTSTGTIYQSNGKEWVALQGS